ncbi:dihydrolipoamide acetyltransferase family protein [Paeniglutamicibacter psychrophenolicus]|uniref:dihydrolipoamide acetyltransferase family protein n=1 Tax=Paeniglutamicibacter psychrophenolicus TaxID=257454 RepID=UPI00278B72FF|nr:dihydrolipoamide acetyltransferase family protein [Paeniglutamicibacter psychrophenolicus]MDQ0094792.1 pyruvate dehydrogenase E2 component (dihydrolipoamide acetyltransferase) [Paeniglutamicibacter psychrophenolicus]
MSNTMEKLFNLPDLGEGLTESEILSWHVAEGDTVALNQVIAEVETAKAVVELPSPFSGVVKKLYEPVGAVVNVGSPLISFDVPDHSGATAGDPKEPAGGAAREPSGGAAQRQPTLVGYGAAAEPGGRPARRARVGATAPVAPAPVAAAAPDPVPAGRDSQAGAPVSADSGPGLRLVEPHDPASQGIGYLRATPPVRKLARDHNIDLRSLRGTGTNGLITRQDVVQALEATALTEALPQGPVPPAAAAGETRTPIRGVRKATAAAMVASAFTAPHVTEFLSVDVTETMALLERLRASRRFADVKITVTTLVAKVVTLALAKHRMLNSHWDEEHGEIVEFGHVNLGIAAATGRGLMVPVIHNAQDLDLAQLAAASGELTRAAREGTITPAQLGGGTFTISNVGVFGIDGGTPILSPGQAGILAVGQVRKMPWEHLDEIALRQVMVLSLSFDHRLVDGEQGARFLSEVGAILEDPALVMGLI